MTCKERGLGDAWGQRSLQLSQEQKREILALGQHFVSVIGKLRQERQQIISQLNQLVSSPLSWLFAAGIRSFPCTRCFPTLQCPADAANSLLASRYLGTRTWVPQQMVRALLLASIITIF